MEVAVIVACRGPAPWLGETLDAILAQDLPPAEVVVVDDGSDPPLALAPAHRAGVRLVRRAPGRLARARQTGLEATTAPWVAICDADDTWLGHKLSAQAALAAEADVLVGAAVVVGPGGALTGEPMPAPRLEGLTAPALAAHLYEHHSIVASSAVIRRAALAMAGGFAPGALADDWELDLWLRLARAGARFAAIDAPVLRYRRHPGGLTADVTELARVLLAARARHADVVDDAVRRRVRGRDLRTLARGEVRRRDYGAARDALREAAALAPPPPRARALAFLLRVPGLREGLGRRDPYRRRG